MTPGRRTSEAGDAESLAEFVASVEHLPLFSGTAARLVRSVDADDISAVELARQIATDAALVAQLLRLVNSSYYGLSRRIATVNDAITVLGLDLVRRVVIAAVLQRPFFAYLHDTRAARAFWRHQLLCAGLARHLHRRKGANGEVAHIAGLLHDVGRLVMIGERPEEAEALMGARELDDDAALAHERTRFGFDHAMVGAALLECWDVPEPIVACAGRHVDEAEPDDALSASVWHANLLSHRLYDDGADPADDALLDAFGIDAAVRTSIADEVAAFESASA